MDAAYWVEIITIHDEVRFGPKANTVKFLFNQHFVPYF